LSEPLSKEPINREQPKVATAGTGLGWHIFVPTRNSVNHFPNSTFHHYVVDTDIIIRMIIRIASYTAGDKVPCNPITTQTAKKAVYH
jgi:hypothetical protein